MGLPVIRGDTDSICARCEKFTTRHDPEAAREGTGFCTIHERTVRWDAWACGPLWHKAPSMAPRNAYIAAQRAREEGESHAAG